ncbi:MAG: hypothetical protein K8L99_32110 [Anaerolineae bacterium]|nr:hypothetical protein [Anaerolineae bacterium]
MRQFQTLDKIQVDPESGVMSLSAEGHPNSPMISMRREGAYIAISASFGPLEIALRPRFEELERLLGRLKPVQGLQTTRQVGTSQAYLAMGLQGDGSLILRPTIAADATGHLSINLLLTPSTCKALYDWLPVQADA